MQTPDLHTAFVEFLHKDDLEHWYPWKEWPLICPICGDTWFIYDSIKCVGYGGRPLSLVVYRCPKHPRIESSICFNHETDMPYKE